VSASTTTAVTAGSVALFAYGDIVTFGNGVDTISGFTIGTDALNMNGYSSVDTTANPTSLIDQIFGNLDEDKVFAVRGTWSSSAGTFTLAAAGADTLMVANDGVNADDVSTTNTTWVVLIGAVTPTQTDLVTGLLGGA
jgi:hypothetical protein